MTTIETFIKKLPKAELHVHIEGTLEPELMFEIAKRNNKTITYQSVAELKKAYDFDNLQDFLDIYYKGASVLETEQDFYDITWAYVKKAHAQQVFHTEIFFDPQTHTDREITFQTVVNGINTALQDGKKKLGISTKLIMCFLRHLDEASAMQTLEEAMQYKDTIIGVGLDSSELGHPPSKFKNVFEKARKEGFVTVAHAGEEGPAAYIREALDILKVSRIDHGNHALDDEKLVQELVDRRIPLTVCPLSNLKLKVVKKINRHPLQKMMQKGLLVTINSDDPAYFGGYINENYTTIAKALDLSIEELAQIAKNSFEASFLDQGEKQKMIAAVERYYQDNR